jgi:four helix bundle protein
MALSFMEWLICRTEGQERLNRLFRQLDEAGTSMILNIAEGNGRYAELDHHHFLQIAQGAAIKGMVYLDLTVKNALLGKAEANTGKGLLFRISALTLGF